jgi:predicted N-acyltransferase
LTLPTLSIKIHPALCEIPRDAWNALVKDNNPFMKHEFLAALEQHHCATQRFGWIAHHIAIYQADDLVAAMPVYEKYNSYGEFVFDQAWAEAWQRAGLAYFPKLVTAIPYTPTQGQRLLIKETAQYKATELKTLLWQTLQALAKQRQASGVHVLFAAEEEQNWLEQRQDVFARHDCQFHWHNQAYTNFDDFLMQLTSKKRKNIRQERKRVQKAGLTFRVLDGHTATAADWQQFNRFYQSTFIEKSGTATLNEAFFKTVAKELPDHIVLVMADQADECIAGALMYRSDQHLYGRYWGCSKQVDALHFEACYYQGIEYCIQHGLQSFEPGAQGEHKIARGFVPTLTRSSHWMTDNPFQQGIQHYVKQEQSAIADYMAECMQHNPYRNTVKC